MAALRVSAYDDGNSPPSIVIKTIPTYPNWVDALSPMTLKNLERELDPRVMDLDHMALNKGKSLDQVVDILKKYGFIYLVQEVSQKGDGEETIVDMYKKYRDLGSWPRALAPNP